MSGITCDQVRAAALDPGAGAGDWARRPNAAGHVRQCPACQDWFDAFAAGEQAWATEPEDAFAAEVLARTAGADEVVADLPRLADMDPGPGFTDRVLMATSRKPAPAGWRERAAGAWQNLVRRPRFAWEAAYVATVCWVLVFGNPVGAIEWSATSIGTIAREQLGGRADEFRADLETWRARRAPAQPSAGSADSARQGGELPPVLRAWQAAAGWLRGVTASVVDAIGHVWTGLAGWIGRAVDQLAPPATEPPAEPARSPQ